jgi:hypothetical protein
MSEYKVSKEHDGLKDLVLAENQCNESAAAPAFMEQEKTGQNRSSLNKMYKINTGFCYLLCTI